jgi:hypothetical protein
MEGKLVAVIGLVLAAVIFIALGVHGKVGFTVSWSEWWYIALGTRVGFVILGVVLLAILFLIITR